MAYSKTIVCLSVALQGRGRSIVGKAPEGGWVRPVSYRPSGEFFPGECLYATGAMPRLLDLMSISFDRPAKEGHQQENHIAAPEPWIPSGRLAYEDLSSFVDNPVSLWETARDNSNEWNDSIRLEVAKKFDHSLLLIKPDSLQMRVGVEGRFSRRLVVRSYFRYGDMEYSLQVTDELAQIAFLDRGLGHYKLDAHLCVGLTKPSLEDGLCRKVTLGVISRGPF